MKSPNLLEVPVSGNKEQTHQQRTGLRNSVASVLVRGIAGLSRAGVLVLIASRYGPVEFGRLTLALSFFEIFRTFSEFGIDIIAIRRFRRHAEAPESLFSALIVTKTTLATICYLLSLAVVFGFSHSPHELYLAAVIGGSLLWVNIAGVFVSYLQSSLRMPTALISAGISYSFYVGLSLTAIKWHLPLLMVVAVQPFCEMLNALVLMVLTRFRWRSPASKLKASLGLLKESLPLGLMSAMVILCFRLDNIFVYRMAGDRMLGLYSSAVRLVEPALMIPHAFSVTLFSVLSGLATLPRGRKLFKIIAGLMWPAYAFIALASVTFTLGARAILGLVSPQYLEAAPVLRILAIALILRGANITATQIILAQARYPAMMKITAATLAFNVIAVFTMLKLFGFIGAAGAALLTEFFNLGLQIKVARQVRPGQRVSEEFAEWGLAEGD